MPPHRPALMATSIDYQHFYARFAYQKGLVAVDKNRWFQGHRAEMDGY